MASPAKQGQIEIIQPDGSSIIVEIHGDEFLNWMTCSDKLVARGSDDFIYFASFDLDGRSIPSKTRAKIHLILIEKRLIFSLQLLPSKRQITCALPWLKEPNLQLKILQQAQINI